MCLKLGARRSFQRRVSTAMPTISDVQEQLGTTHDHDLRFLSDPLPTATRSPNHLRHSTGGPRNACVARCQLVFYHTKIEMPFPRPARELQNFGLPFFDSIDQPVRRWPDAGGEFGPVPPCDSAATLVETTGRWAMMVGLSARSAPALDRETGVVFCNSRDGPFGRGDDVGSEPSLGRGFGPGSGGVILRGHLVERLGSPRYAEREEAGGATRRLGRHAVAALRAARDDRDPEIRTRTGALLNKIRRAALDPAHPGHARLPGPAASRGGQGGEGVSTGIKLGLVPENSPTWPNRRISLHEAAPLPILEGNGPAVRGGPSSSCNFGMHGFPTTVGEPIFPLLDGGPRPAPTSDQSGPFRVSLLSLHYQRDMVAFSRAGVVTPHPSAPCRFPRRLRGGAISQSRGSDGRRAVLRADPGPCRASALDQPEWTSKDLGGGRRPRPVASARA